VLSQNCEDEYRFRLPWLRFFRTFSSAVRQMPGYNSPSRGTARNLPKFLCCSQNFCVVLCIVCFVSFCVLFVCKCVLYNCHRLATQLRLTNILYHVCLYVCPHGTTRLPLDGFLWNLVFEYFFENLQRNLKFDQNLTRISAALHEDKCFRWKF
jgi:hypothetical protein